MKKLLVALALVLSTAVGAMAGTTTTATTVTTTATKQVVAQVDINTADVATLTTVKGIGKPTAAKIIAGRPYKGKDELLKKKIVTAAQYAQIRNFIIAKQK